jgi:glucose 1-dehydrogenase
MISMMAAVVTPGKKGSIRAIDIKQPVPEASEVLVKVMRAGIDGTDQDINEGRYGVAPEGCEYLVVGHEAIGIVENIGGATETFSPGDIVVSTVRRPCPQRCFSCRDLQADMCLTGDYLERGIKGFHGFMSEYYTEKPDNMIRIPPLLKDVAVLLEPLSVAEKGIDQIFRIQERFIWSPARALVLGAGSLGLLATLILRDMGFETYTIARHSKESPKARIVRDSGGRYIDVNVEPLETLPKIYGPFDMIIEATGASGMVMGSRRMVSNGGIVCLLGLYQGDRVDSVHLDQLNLDMVLNNKVLFGSSSSNIWHFRRGVERMASIEHKWPGIMRKMLTRTVQLENVADGLRRRPDDIKVLVEIAR